MLPMVMAALVVYILLILDLVGFTLQLLMVFMLLLDYMGVWFEQ